MFSHLIFLILAVSLITFANGLPLPLWVTSTGFTVAWGACAYFLLLILIYWQGQGRLLTKGEAYVLVQVELLGFLALFLFALGGNALFFPLLTLNALLNLLLYFGGMALFYYSWAQKEGESLPQLTASQQIRLTFPFVVPFILFLAMVDLLNYLPALSENSGLLWILEIVFLILTLLFLPCLLIAVWQCVPMQDQILKARLEKVCDTAGFKHGGILDWTLLNRSHTAAILGILPSFRYILFTKGLQKELSPESLEAVLAHEIGHSAHRHLLLYPWIFLGVVVLTTLYTLLIGSPLEENYLQSPFYPFLLFLPYALILWFYFRYIFGFFSRLFERQADLHCFALKIPADHMIHALDDIAKATGFTHSAPNWHHHSIQDRIDFLEKAKKNPNLITHHHRLVNVALLIYTAILLGGFYLMENL